MKKTLPITNNLPIIFEEEEWPIIAKAGEEDFEDFLVVRIKKDELKSSYSFIGYGKSKGEANTTTELMCTILSISPPSSSEYYGVYIPSSSGYGLCFVQELVMTVANNIGDPGLGQKALNSMAPREV